MLVQYMWHYITLSTEMSYIIFVLLPKVNTDTWGIGFLEVHWNSVEAVINTSINMAVKFCDIIYSFCTHQGTVTVIIEMKMSQDLGIIDQDPLLLVFL